MMIVPNVDACACESAVIGMVSPTANNLFATTGVNILRNVSDVVNIFVTRRRRNAVTKSVVCDQQLQMLSPTCFIKGGYTKA